MDKKQLIKEIEEYIVDADNAISEDEEFIRGWKSGLLVALELACNVEHENAIVKCKDCKHWIPWYSNPDGTQLGRCAKDHNKIWDESIRYPEWYCADGEHKKT